MVTRSDAPALLDVMTRHQIYLEGFKLHQARKFDPVVQALRAELRGLFFDLEFDQLSDMTKRELDKFIRKLRSAQLKHFNAYTQQVLNDLKLFMQTDVEINADIMRDTQEEDKKALAALLALLTRKHLNSLWAGISSTILPANGMLPEAYLNNFSQSALVALENTVRMAYANKLTPGQALRSITGTSGFNGRDGILNRFSTQAAGLNATLLQHVASLTQEAAVTNYFSRYIWSSVIDSVTTAVCRARNGLVYAFGFGPLPPAHNLCRSKTYPVPDGVLVSPPTYYTWIKQQPVSFQNDVLPPDVVRGLRNGTINSTNLPKFGSISSLTLEQFKSKLPLILAT